MRVRCPNCSQPIELVNDLDFDKISCPSCGSQLNLSGSDADTVTAVFKARIPALQCFQLLEPIGSRAIWAGLASAGHGVGADRGDQAAAQPAFIG